MSTYQELEIKLNTAIKKIETLNELIKDKLCMNCEEALNYRNHATTLCPKCEYSLCDGCVDFEWNYDENCCTDCEDKTEN